MRIIKHTAGAGFEWLGEGFAILGKKKGFLVGTYLFSALMSLALGVVNSFIRMIGFLSGSLSFFFLFILLGTFVLTIGWLIIHLFLYSGLKQVDTVDTPVFASNFKAFHSPTFGTVCKLGVLEFLVSIVVGLIAAAILFILSRNSVDAMMGAAYMGSYSSIPWFTFLYAFLIIVVFGFVSFVFINAANIVLETKWGARKSLAVSFEGVIVKNFLPILIFAFLVFVAFLIVASILIFFVGILENILGSILGTLVALLLMFACLMMVSLAVMAANYSFFKSTFRFEPPEQQALAVSPGEQNQPM